MDDCILYSNKKAGISQNNNLKIYADHLKRELPKTGNHPPTVTFRTTHELSDLVRPSEMIPDDVGPIEHILKNGVG